MICSEIEQPNHYGSFATGDAEEAAARDMIPVKRAETNITANSFLYMKRIVGLVRRPTTVPKGRTTAVSWFLEPVPPIKQQKFTNGSGEMPCL